MAISEWNLWKEASGLDNIRILLCDDDATQIQKLRAELENVFARLCRCATIITFNSPSQISQEHLTNCDIAFLDIDFERENCNGIDVARQLRSVNSRALIFFVTNYIDYAPEGYEVQAFRYILKRDQASVLERYILQAIENLSESQELLRLKDKEQVFDLPLDGILYLEVLDHYVSIHTEKATYTIGATLSSLEHTLESHGFLRVHKSYLVNMGHIRKFRSRECLLTNGTLLSVSEKNYAQQKQKYLLWKGLK